MPQGRMYVYRADDADFYITKNGAKFKIFRLNEYFNNIYERRVIGKRVYTVYFDDNHPHLKGKRNRSFESALNSCALDGEWIVWNDNF